MASQLSLSSCFVLFFFVLFSFTTAKEFRVGGTITSWKIPSSPSENLNKWAGIARFHIGDSLVFKSIESNDSVLQVTKEAYSKCNITAPIAAHKNSKNITVKLERSGPFFFISGASGKCEKGEKLIVVVMSRKRRNGAPAPSPWMHHSHSPAPAPARNGANMQSGLMAALVAVGFGILFM